VNVGLAIVLAKWSPLGALGVAVAGAIVLTAKNTLFTSIYGAIMLKLPWHTFLFSMLPGLVGTVSVGLVSYGLTRVYTIHSWFGLAGIALVSSVLYAASVYFFMLHREDRLLLTSLLPLEVK
jgi:hypothetical protein